MSEHLLTPAQAAERLGGPSKLTRMIRTGRLAHVRVGRGSTLASMRFRAEDVEAVILALGEPKTPTVYIAGFSQYVKIGFSEDLPGRLLDLQEHLPTDLVLYASFRGSIADERRLQARFSSYRTRSEWFLKRGKLRAWIAEGCPVHAA